jgi:hypothetical protein
VAGIRHALNSSRQFVTAHGDSSILPDLRSASPLDNQVQEDNDADNYQMKAPQYQPAGHEELSSTALVPSSSVFEPSSQLDEEETLVEEVLEEEFDNSAQDLWEDMRVVSRKVLRYASDVLRLTAGEKITSGSIVKHSPAVSSATEGLTSDSPMEIHRERNRLRSSLQPRKMVR